MALLLVVIVGALQPGGDGRLPQATAYSLGGMELIPQLGDRGRGFLFWLEVWAVRSCMAFNGCGAAWCFDTHLVGETSPTASFMTSGSYSRSIHRAQLNDLQFLGHPDNRGARIAANMVGSGS